MDHRSDRNLMSKVVNNYFLMSMKLSDEFPLNCWGLNRLYDTMEWMMNTCNKDSKKNNNLIPNDDHKLYDALVQLAYSTDAFLDDNDDVENDLVRIPVRLIHEYANLINWLKKRKQENPKKNFFLLITYNVLCHLYLVLL